MPYVPIQFPSVLYGPKGDSIVVPDTVTATTMPPTFTAVPVAPSVDPTAQSLAISASAGELPPVEILVVDPLGIVPTVLTIVSAPAVVPAVAPSFLVLFTIAYSWLC